MTPGAVLLIRADAGLEMGTGHVMRTLALAQAWQDEGGKVAYAVTSCPAGVEERLLQEDIEVVRLSPQAGSVDDARATAEAARERGACWVVLDGYHFGGDYQEVVKRGSRSLLAVDDFGHAGHYWADVVLNQDLNAEEGLYRNREPYTRLLLGPDFVCLRREFRRHPQAGTRRPQRPTTGPVRRLLVTLGGSDPGNVTLQVLQALAASGYRELETIVLIGPSNRHGASLEAEVQRHGNAVRLLRNPPNIPELMAWCDAAITAGGSTLWELACFAVPCLVLVIAANQGPCARKLHDQQACKVLGEAADFDSAVLAAEISVFLRDAPLRAILGQKFAALVDGRGAQCACDAMRAEPAKCAT